MATSSARTGTQRKEKVTISVDAGLLHLVDAFVEESKTAGMSRSSIIEQALHLWKQEMRNHFDAKYYAENAAVNKADNDSWSAITTEAAKHTWKD
jgi:metal-responsive CopG/Arc/MetJ family transcriptional regulator